MHTVGDSWNMAFAESEWPSQLHEHGPLYVAVRVLNNYQFIIKAADCLPELMVCAAQVDATSSPWMDYSGGIMSCSATVTQVNHAGN